MNRDRERVEVKKLTIKNYIDLFVLSTLLLVMYIITKNVINFIK